MYVCVSLGLTPIDQKGACAPVCNRMLCLIG